MGLGQRQPAAPPQRKVSSTNKKLRGGILDSMCYAMQSKHHLAMCKKWYGL